MPTLIDFLASSLHCTPAELHLKWEPRKVSRLLARKRMRTLHLGDHNRAFFSQGLSSRCARHTMAYRGKLGINVEQHYFVRHHVTLKYPLLPCIVERCGGQHKNFWPLEVITF